MMSTPTSSSGYPPRAPPPAVPCCCHWEGMLAPPLPSPVQRAVKLLTPKATHHRQWLGPPPMAGSHQQLLLLMGWGELSPCLLCGFPRCDILPPHHGHLPPWASPMIPFHLGKLRHGALLCSTPDWKVGGLWVGEQREHAPTSS